MRATNGSPMRPERVLSLRLRQLRTSSHAHTQEAPGRSRRITREAHLDHSRLDRLGQSTRVSSSDQTGSRVALYAAIRRDARAGLSNRALQRKYKVGYRTVAAAMDSAWPQPRQSSPERGSRLDPYRDIIDAWLREDLDAPRKQRHTAKRIFDRLPD